MDIVLVICVAIMFFCVLDFVYRIIPKQLLEMGVKFLGGEIDDTEFKED
jgi:hypothetical protein